MIAEERQSTNPEICRTGSGSRLASFRRVTAWKKEKYSELIGLQRNGTGGRTRTGTLLRASDFESDVSTNFTTPALSAVGNRLTRATHRSARDYSNRLRKFN
jgi:hypothetical protein